jgi:hypothetical protein
MKKNLSLRASFYLPKNPRHPWLRGTPVPSVPLIIIGAVAPLPEMR